MKHRVSIGVLLGLVAALVPSLVLASYAWYIDLTVKETAGNSYEACPLYATVNNTYLGSAGYIQPYWQSTRVYGPDGNPVPHMLTTDRVWFVGNVPANSEQSYRYALSDNEMTAFKIIVGRGGYVTTGDIPPFEPSGIFQIGFSGEVLTDSYPASVYSKGSAVSMSVTGSGELTFQADGLAAGTAEWVSDGGDSDIEAMTTDGTHLYFSVTGDDGYGYIVKMDLATMTEEDRWGPGPHHITALVYDDFTNRLYAGGLSNFFCQILPSNMTTLAENNYGDADEYIYAMVSGGDGYIYAIGSQETVLRIQASSLVIETNGGTLGAGNHLYSLASDGGSYIYAAGELGGLPIVEKLLESTLDVSDNWTGIVTDPDFREASQQLTYRDGAVFCGMSNGDVIKLATLTMTENDRWTGGLNSVHAVCADADYVYAVEDSSATAKVYTLDPADLSDYLDRWDAETGQHYAEAMVVVDGKPYVGCEDDPARVFVAAATWGTLTLTATDVASGNHVLLIDCDGETATFYVDGVARDSLDAGGTVTDTDDDWTWMSDVTPYANYISIEVDGSEVLRYQPNLPISGTTLPDLDETEDGVITWGDLPEGLTVQANVLHSNVTGSTPMAGNAPWLLVPTPPATPSLFGEGGRRCPD